MTSELRFDSFKYWGVTSRSKAGRLSISSFAVAIENHSAGRGDFHALDSVFFRVAAHLIAFQDLKKDHARERKGRARETRPRRCSGSDPEIPVFVLLALKTPLNAQVIDLELVWIFQTGVLKCS